VSSAPKNGGGFPQVMICGLPDLVADMIGFCQADIMHCPGPFNLAAVLPCRARFVRRRSLYLDPLVSDPPSNSAALIQGGMVSGFFVGIKVEAFRIRPLASRDRSVIRGINWIGSLRGELSLLFLQRFRVSSHLF